MAGQVPLWFRAAGVRLAGIQAKGQRVGQWGIGTWGQLGTEGSGYLNTASQTPAYTYSTVSGLKTGEDLELSSVGTAGVISATYAYTSAGRLLTATIGSELPEKYSFDVAGNLTLIEKYVEGDWETSADFDYDTGNRLTSLTAGTSTTLFTFDAGKRWRTQQGPSEDPDQVTFSYTGTGRLATYTDELTGVSATYTYDSAGQRTRSVVTDASGTTTTDFTYTGLALQSLSATWTDGGTPETTESWKLTYLYDEYGRPYGGIYRDTTDSNPANWPDPVFLGILTTDRGDVVGLLDKNGNPFAAYRYDAWGNPLGAGTEGTTGIWWQATTQGENEVIGLELAETIALRQPLRYAGYCYDPESGMYYLSARHYDPATRQFLSKDLSRNDGEQSAYQYCLGNPVGNVDPTGCIWNPFKALKEAIQAATRWAWEKTSGTYKKPMSFGGKWRFNSGEKIVYTQRDYADWAKGKSYDEVCFFNGYLKHALQSGQAARPDEDRDRYSQRTVEGVDWSGFTGAEILVQTDPRVLDAIKTKGGASYIPNVIPMRAFNWIGALGKVDAGVMKSVVDVATQGKYIQRALEYNQVGYAVPMLAALDDYPSNNSETQYRKSDEVLMLLTEGMAKAGWVSE